MTSSPTVTLFTQQIDPSRRPITLAASALIHAAVCALVSFGIFYAPQVDTHTKEHFIVRELDLHRPEAQAQRAAKGIEYPSPQTGSGAASQAAPRSAMRQAVQAQAGPQTLLQPDLPRRLALAEEIPVPQVLIWTPRMVITKTIVPPTPEQPTAADVHPSLNAPNQEVNLADVELASTAVPARKLRIMPSTTSPVVVHGSNLIQLAPSTAAQVALQPTPTALLALSDVRMNNGAANLPPLNETVKTSAPGMLAPGPARDPGSGGKGSSAAKGGGTGQGTVASQSSPGVSGPQGQPNGALAGLAQGANAGSALGDPTASTQITLPKNGQFSAVIVGDALEDQYPEMAGVWGGRMAYTVYLHVGATRSWILQYSLPRAADAAAGGNVDRLEAPWPYNIVRPNLDAGSMNADALMVHGFVNQSGRFEALSMLFPQAFPQVDFILKALAQWQFRPAMLGGKVARVEVLLIIPEELQ